MRRAKKRAPAEAEQESGDERDQRRDQHPVLDQVDGRERVLERARDEDDVLRCPLANGSAASAYFCPPRVTTPRAEVQGLAQRRSATASSAIPTTVPPAAFVADIAEEQRATGSRSAKIVTRVFVAEAKRLRKVARRACSADAQSFDDPRGDRAAWSFLESDQPVLERRHDEQVDEGEDAEHDDEQREAEPGPDRSEPAHGSRSR